jgi:hypothetical protein
MIVSASASHAFRLPVCDLKQNFAVWQAYALNDFHFPMDCVFEGFEAPAVCARETLRPAQTAGKREIARVSKVLRRIALAAKICFQPPATCGCAHSTNEQVGRAKSARLCFQSGKDML